MNFDRARFNMVEQQVRPWEVLDTRILELLETVHREDFVPVRYRKLAFADMEVPLSGGQTMMRPKVEGRMLQSVAIRANETVLEIGTGSGFITACVSHLARSVSSVEISEQLHAEASARLRDKRLNNIELHVADALSGWQPEQAHDVLLVTGSVPDVPDTFRNWVNPGGRMFIVTGESPAMEAKLLARISASDWTEQSLFETDLIRLINADQPPQFEF